MYGDEIWDEHRWEQFLRENDKRVDRFMHHLYGFISNNPLPDANDPDAVAAWEAELRAFLTARGLPYDETAFPFFIDNEHLADEDHLPGDPASDDVWELDDEDLLYDEEEVDDLDDFMQLPIYQQAFDLATLVLDWSESLDGDEKDSALVHFCTHATQIPAQVAKGHGLGFERDFIGGNIACVKRALGEANGALTLLREMKKASYMDPESYRELYEHTYEVRNRLGLYIQDLRARFDLGID